MKPLATVALVGALVLPACYTYSPSTIGDLTPGDQVRARLTGAQFDELDEHLPGGDRVLEGEVIESGNGGILLEVPVATSVQGIRVQSYHQRLDIPSSGLAEVELRALNKHRTYTLSGAAIVAVGYVIWDQLLSDTRRGGTDPPPPPEEDRRTVIKIPLFVW
ncbi:MAG: hypothetical protein OEO23_05720 [Gemmatimonadota bacterium]|nr:hypothetical protein [Gemmatimonadota bacterium]